MAKKKASISDILKNNKKEVNTDAIDKATKSILGKGEKEPTKRLSIDIPVSFYKEIKQGAMDEDTTIKNFVLTGVRDKLNK